MPGKVEYRGGGGDIAVFSRLKKVSTMSFSSFAICCARGCAISGRTGLCLSRQSVYWCHAFFDRRLVFDFENINHIFSRVNRQNIAVAFAREDCTDEQLQVLTDKIKGITNVCGVEFISREQALKNIRTPYRKPCGRSLKAKTTRTSTLLSLSFRI